MHAGNRSPRPAARADEVRTFAGVIAAGLLLGGVASVLLRTAGEWALPQSAQAARSSSDPGGVPPAPGAAQASPAPGAASARTAPVPAAGKVPGAVSRAAQSPSSAAVRHVSTGTGKAPAAEAVARSAAHLDEHVTYHYNALGRRDPFQSLLGGEYVGADVGGHAPPDVGGVKVVGIVWGDADQFALVEDARGDSHILRRGDKVMNGYVETLTRDAMIVNLTLDGQPTSVRVPLTRKGDKSNANR